MKTSRIMLAALLLWAVPGCSDDTTTKPKPDTIKPKDSTVDHAKGDGPQADLGPQPDGAADSTPTDSTPDPDKTPPADLPAGPSGKIALARQTPDGTANVAITDAFVTYIKAPLGTDIGGFFIQAAKDGPALFIGVDPATLTPVPKVGDQIALTVTEMATDPSDIRYAKAVSNVSTATPATDPLPGLLQDVSAVTDLVSNVVGYEVELIGGTFKLTKAFASAGTAFVAAEAETTGVTGNTLLKFRLPETLQKKLGLIAGCSVTIKATPMWHYKATAQPSVQVDGDIASYTCPAPTVVSAAAPTSTSVRVTFDRPIATVNANGSEFTFDNGLTASAAALDASGLFVDLTTGQQVGTTTYKVTVAATVLDAKGQGVDPTKNTATFLGFTTRAKVLINELNANIPSCDRLELLVTAGGSMGGFELRERGTVLFYTFPAGFAVATGDVIVVHFNGGNATCNPASATDETTSKNQFPQTPHTNNYDTAWDVWGTTTAGLTATTNAIKLVDDVGTIVDAVVATDGTSNAAAASISEANVIANANEWTLPTGGFDATNFNANAATGLKPSTTVTGDSLQRKNTTDTNGTADWGIAPSTFGVKNAGQ